MKENILVTVLILTNNRPKIVTNALKSVLRQSYLNLEVIVINNNILNSFDYNETNKNIKSINDSRVKIIDTNKVNPTIARNEGIRLSKGLYISFLDDDDQWYPNKIEVQLQYFPKYDAVLNGYQEIYEESSKISFPNKKGYISIIDFFKGGTLGGRLSSLIIKAEIIKKFQFEEQIRISEESILIARLLKNNYKIAYINDYLSIISMYTDDQQLSRTNSIFPLNELYKYFNVNPLVKKELGFLYKVQLSKVIIGVNLKLKSLKIGRIFQSFIKAGPIATILVVGIKSYNFLIRKLKTSYH